MGFKQSPLPIVEGTSSHKSALKIVEAIAMEAVGGMMKDGGEGGGSKDPDKKGEFGGKGFGGQL